MLVVLGHIGLLVVITVAARRDQKFEPTGRQAIPEISSLSGRPSPTLDASDFQVSPAL
jgi:hypothetical protein